MLRKLCTLVLSLAFVVAITGCEEKEVKVVEYKNTQKTEVQTESTPTDVSPGTMIVD